MTPTEHLRHCRAMARACKQENLDLSRRDFIAQALYWRAKRRYDRRYA